jgi:tRNA U34 5-methylaminomethyl-2-thiouridine-forming methyltransferase MnmC
MENTESFTPQLTEDGSFTFFSAQFGEMFHSRYGAKQEAEKKFVAPTELRHKALKSSLKLLDVCYGLGYNTAAALETIWQVNPDCCVEWIGLELDPSVPKSAIAHHLLDAWNPSLRKIITDLATVDQVQTNRLAARLLIGDARITIQQVYQSGFQADAIFLDPFSPPTCPQLWTVEFLGLVAKCLKQDGKLATYSCSAAVRTALMAAMLHIGATAPVGRRTPGTVAGYTNDLPPLSLQEQEHLHTKAAVPYRDPSLCDTSDAIAQRRQIEQQTSSLEPTSRWKQRWSMTQS